MSEGISKGDLDELLRDETWFGIESLRERIVGALDNMGDSSHPIKGRLDELFEDTRVMARDTSNHCRETFMGSMSLDGASEELQSIISSAADDVADYVAKKTERATLATILIQMTGINEPDDGPSFG